MKRNYKVVVVNETPKIPAIDFEEVIIEKDNKYKIDKKKLRAIVISALVIAISVATQDVSLAAGTETYVPVNYQTPTQLKAIMEFIQWLIQLLRLIVSGIAGLICTFAGYKWATAIEANGQESAKKILKNAFVGGLLVWTGTSIADFFVGKMNQILL